jgi:phospholipase C
VILVTEIEGDNYLASLVQAIMNGPNWGSTAIFITYDDCGCTYDHVPPAGNVGIRVPMVIVSPYAKARFTDSTTATYASILAFTEHNWALQPLTSADAAAYDYHDSFAFTQTPLGTAQLRQNSVPGTSLRQITAHPPSNDTLVD